MRVVAATRILDEIDLVEAFVRHTLAHCDHLVLLDNGSRDGTLEVLAALVAEGLPLTVLANPSVSFAEAEANSFLFRHAARTLGAHWVAFLDADEFIDDRRLEGGFRHLLSETLAIRPLVAQIKVALTDYVAIHADPAHDALVPRRIAWRGERGTNLKTIVRADPAHLDAEIRPGGHGAWWPVSGYELWDHPVELDLTYAHYPERSAWQWISKFVRGWAKVLAAGPDAVAAGNSSHYRDAFALLRDDPAAIFGNPLLMGCKNERPGLVHDPIAYLGGPLRHTPPFDERFRAVRSLAGALEDLATRHGRLLHESAEARALSDAWNEQRPGLCPGPARGRSPSGHPID